MNDIAILQVAAPKAGGSQRHSDGAGENGEGASFAEAYDEAAPKAGTGQRAAPESTIESSAGQVDADPRPADPDAALPEMNLADAPAPVMDRQVVRGRGDLLSKNGQPILPSPAPADVSADANAAPIQRTPTEVGPNPPISSKYADGQGLSTPSRPGVPIAQASVLAKGSHGHSDGHGNAPAGADQPVGERREVPRVPREPEDPKHGLPVRPRADGAPLGEPRPVDPKHPRAETQQPKPSTSPEPRPAVRPETATGATPAPQAVQVAQTEAVRPARLFDVGPRGRSETDTRTSAIPDDRSHAPIQAAKGPTAAVELARAQVAAGAAAVPAPTVGSKSVAAEGSGFDGVLVESTPSERADALLSTVAAPGQIASPSGPTVPTAPTPQLAQHAARQLAVSVVPLPDGPIEISLSPEELGRVRMTVSVHDGAIAVTLQAERPETADLLRRHIDSLAKEFSEMGYDQSSFTFERPDSDGDSSGSSNAGDTGGPHGGDMTDIAEEDPDHAPVPRGSGLDLRL